jgi:CarboxypepD_reg-like domain
MQRILGSILLLVLLGWAGTAQAQRTAAPAPARKTAEQLALSEPAATAPAAPVSYALQGQVLNEEGQPLPGATVYVKSNKQVYITNAEGYFVFNSPRPTEAVSVSRAGYSDAEMQLRRGNADSVTLQLLPGTRIKRSGRNAGQIKSVGQATKD